MIGRQKVLVQSLGGCEDLSETISGFFVLGNGKIGFALSIDRVLEICCG